MDPLAHPGAGGEIAQGPYQTVPGPRKSHQLPGRCALCVLRRQFEHRVQSAVVRGWSPSEFCHLCGVDNWRETDFCSPSVPRRISPVPLPTQCPAHHLPAALSPEPATTDEPLPHGATELRIAAEPELRFPSDQVQETGNHARHEEESRGQ